MDSSSYTRRRQVPLPVPNRLAKLDVVGLGNGANWKPVNKPSALYVAVNGTPVVGMAGLVLSELMRVFVKFAPVVTFTPLTRFRI